MIGWSAIRDWGWRHPRWAAALVLIGLGIGSAVFFIAQRDAQARGQWRQAQAALAEFEFDRAREHLAAYLSWRYFDGQAHFQLARACRRATSENFALAREHLQAAQALGVSADEIQLERVLVNVQETGDMGPEESFLKLRLEGQSDQQPLILEALSRGCLRAGLVNKANAWLDQWVEHSPDDWYARLWRGCLFQHTGKPQLAIEDFSLVWRHRPEDLAARKQLGLALAASGYDYQAAVGHLEHCRHNEPSDPDVQIALADCYRAVGRAAESRPLLEAALNARPADHDGLVALALLELHLDNPQGALAALEQLEKNGPAFDADEALHRLLHLDPVANPPYLTERQEKLLFLKGTALRRLGRGEEADRCLAELEQIRKLTAELKAALKEQKQRPQHADLMVRLGRIYLELNLSSEAVAWLEKALKRNSRHREAHGTLADYYQTLNSDYGRQQALHHRQMARGE